jgi:serine/threonine protein kinase
MCAVKLIADHWSETKALMKLSHPHILPVYEAGESDSRLFIAMPFVEGRDLGAILRETGHNLPNFIGSEDVGREN